MNETGTDERSSRKSRSRLQQSESLQHLPTPTSVCVGGVPKGASKRRIWSLICVLAANG